MYRPGIMGGKSMTQNMDKRKQRSSRTFEDAMIRLLNRMDYKDITVSALIKEADYSRTAFYNSFLDKDDCLTRILDRQAGKLFYSIF